MTFEERLKAAAGQISVPDELSPDNIKTMLDLSGIVQDPAEECVVEVVPALCVSESLASVTPVPRRTPRQTSLIRALAALAACAALAGGIQAIQSRNKPEPIATDKSYEAVQQVSSYDELYSIYSGLYNEHVLSDEEQGDGVEIAAPAETTVGTAISVAPIQTEVSYVGTAGTPAVTAAESVFTVYEPEPIDEPVRSDFSDADIVKDSDDFIYYLCGGTLYCVDKKDMSSAKVESEYSPFEMDIYGNFLLLIGRETEADNGYVTAEIFDISSKEPVLVRSYRQNGEYVSTRTDSDGYLMIVTSCSKAGLDGSIESYVPKYFINGEKFFIDPSDVYVPQTATNVDYTVLSTVPLDGSKITVKAVLGGGANVFCTDDTLFVAGVDSESVSDRTYITSFGVSCGRLEYRAEGSVNGALLSKRSMGYTEGKFRIACTEYDEYGQNTTTIYSLDSDLNVISRQGGLAEGCNDVKVRFEGSVASLFTGDAFIDSVDMDFVPETAAEETAVQSTAVSAVSTMAVQTSPQTSVGSGLSFRLSRADSGSLTASLTDGEGNVTGVFGIDDLLSADSMALYDTKAVLVDEERKFIGFPVTGKVIEDGREVCVNRYYLFSSADGTLYSIGFAQFDDLGDTFVFDRAVIDGNELVLMGSGKMATVDLYTMTVRSVTDL